MFFYWKDKNIPTVEPLDLLGERGGREIKKYMRQVKDRQTERKRERE